MEEKSVVILAGGKGERMNSIVPKQFMCLNGKPVLMHTIEQFYKYSRDINIILVLPEDLVGYWEALCVEYDFDMRYQFVHGGKNRFESVRNGLAIVPPSGLVAIHDGVRPLVSVSLINDLFNKATITGNAIPVVDIIDSVRYVKDDVNRGVNRNEYKIVQTPQVFNTDFLKLAYSLDHEEDFSDDASLVESLNIKINTVNGDKQNIKLTYDVDLLLAEAIVSSRS